MNMQRENAFSNNKFSTSNFLKKSNAFSKKKLFDTSKETVEIDEAMKSVNLPNHMFSNFLKGHKDPMFKFTKEHYYSIKNNRYNIFEEFELKDVEFKENLSKEKLVDIVNSTFDRELQFNTVYRFKHRGNPKFQLYVNKENNNFYKVIIIDLYHLVIPAIDRSRERKKADIKADYEAVKNYDYCLSNLKN